MVHIHIIHLVLIANNECLQSFWDIEKKIECVDDPSMIPINAIKKQTNSTHIVDIIPAIVSTIIITLTN